MRWEVRGCYGARVIQKQVFLASNVFTESIGKEKKRGKDGAAVAMSPHSKGLRV